MAESSGRRQVDHVGHTGIYPASGPLPSGPAEVRGQGELGHPEERREIRRRAHQQWEERTALLLGRALFGGYFLFSGIHHFRDGEMLTEYARSKGVPYPGAAVAASGAMLVLGGLSLLAGVKPRAGASLIAAFLLGVTPKMHDFWRFEGERRMQEMINFTKNVALLGGAALAAAVPEPWPASAPLGRGAIPRAAITA